MHLLRFSGSQFGQENALKFVVDFGKNEFNFQKTVLIFLN